VTTLINQSDYCAEMIPLIDASGRNVGCVVVKGTFDLHPNGLVQSPSQLPILYADEMGSWEQKEEIAVPADLVDYKPGTDVIVGRASEEYLRNVSPRKFGVRIGPVSISDKLGSEWSVGPLARDDKDRLKLAGTFDESWQSERMPLLPKDFDLRYNQSAPTNQVVAPHLLGHEAIAIEGMYPALPRVQGSLPGQAILVSGNVGNRYFLERAVLDTVFIFSEAPRISLTWRYSIQCQRKIEEIGNVYVKDVRLRNAAEVMGGL